MEHLTFNSGALRYSLVGNCLSVYDSNGKKLWFKFFESIKKAREIFAELAL